MKFLALTAGAILTASTAFAGGYAEPIAEPAPAAPIAKVAVDTEWTGFYAGLQFGQGSADVAAEGESLDVGDYDAYGVHAGYLYDLGQFVLGGEFDYNLVETEVQDFDGNLMRLRARAGYDLGRFQPYLTAGVARLTLDNGQDNVSETGFTYGIGAEYLVSDQISLGLEYSRSDFSDVLEEELGTSGIDLETDLIQARVSYRF
jgi:opacity protein-like surface antigen